MCSLNQKAKLFHALHSSADALLLANSWDPISTLLTERAGAKVIATASAAIAAALGYRDGECVPKKEMLGAIERLSRVTQLPLTVDIERGYGETRGELQNTIEQLIDMGACGINIEDSLTEGGDLRTPSEQAARIEAVREVAEKRGVDLFINARIDCFLQRAVTPDEALAKSLERARAYNKAGCSGIFTPGVYDLPVIHALREQIKLPLNLIHIPTLTNVAQLQAAGINRISLGPFFMRACMAEVQKIAEQLLNENNFAPLETAMNKTYSLKDLLVTTLD